jgi:succinate dehydrogenase / fumarate reductase flavoprotein subunit
MSTPTITWSTVSYDVLIIGAGGSGLRAAIEAAAAGLSVGVISKSLLGKAHTVMAEGGVAAALANVDSRDDWRTHYRDTMKSGHYINNSRMAELLAKEAPERVLELEAWGAVFDRTDSGRIMQRPFGAHTYPRLAHVGDRTGKELLRTVQDRATALGVVVHAEMTVTRLFRVGDRVAGCLAYYRPTGEFVLFRARAVVLATGGGGRIYRVTSNSWECTGDGLAMAAAIGARLVDMEMVQFHPTGMVWPPGVRGLLVTEGVRGEGGILLNSEGERFMQRYDPERMELSSRDVVARSIYSEVQAGRGTPHGGVWLDITHRGADYILKKLPGMRSQFLNLADVDITKERMEVAPTCHYMMGGIKVEADTCATDVAGLFAAGEVAGGVHGANRLGGNSLADLLVFGRRAGLAVTEFVQSADWLDIPAPEVAAEVERVLEPLARDGGENPYHLHRELQDIMTQHAGIVRTGERLEEGLGKLLELKERAGRMAAPGSRRYNPGWHMVFDVHSMLALGEAIFRSALARQESRGAHHRLDCPGEQPELGAVNYVSRWRDDGFVVEAVEAVPITPELRELLPGLDASRKEVGVSS